MADCVDNDNGFHKVTESDTKLTVNLQKTHADIHKDSPMTLTSAQGFSSDETSKANDELETLKTQLKEQSDRHAAELSNLTDILAKKNKLIDTMRVKINRYEFAVKEAILFLGKPMESYDHWLHSRELLQPDPATAHLPRPDNAAALLATAPHTISHGLAAAIDGARSAERKSVAAGAAISITAAPPSPPTERQAVPAPQNPTKARLLASEPPASSRGRSASAAPNLGPTTPTAVDVPRPSSTAVARVSGASTFEIQCLECMRLALNYLKNAQASVQALSQQPDVDKCNWERLSTGAPPDIEEKKSTPSQQEEVESLSAESHKKSNPSIRLHTASVAGGNRPSVSPLANAAGVILIGGSDFTATPDEDNSDLGSANPDEHEQEDSIFAKTSASTSPIVSTTIKCPSCRERMLQIDNYVDNVNYLKRDMTMLANQLEEERAARERIQMSKDILEQELEELTAQLFDQANRLVIDEARLRDELENANKKLRGELRDWVKKVDVREDELRELKRSLIALECAKMRSASFSITNNHRGGSSNNLQALQLPDPKRYLVPRVGASGFGLFLSVPIDGILFAEFQDHIKQGTAANSLPQAQSLLITLNTPFVKRCMHEDVEPCLFYAYQHPNMAGANNIFRTTGMSASLKKRLLEASQRNACELQPYWSSTEDLLPAKNSQLGRDESFSLDGSAQTPVGSSLPPGLEPPPKVRCTMCTIVRECDFRLRFYHAPSTNSGAPMAFGEWNPLCRCCRDRLAAVNEFFSYILQLKASSVVTESPGGHGSQLAQQRGTVIQVQREVTRTQATILGMFRHAQWLRRKMALSRVGSNALFDGESSVGSFGGANTGGGSSAGEWEKYVQIIN